MSDTARVNEPEVLWTPSAQRVQGAAVTRYQQWLEQTRGLRFERYHDLWQWSVDELEAFWASLVEFGDVRFEEPGTAVLGSWEMPGATWYPGARLNYAEHLFRGKPDDEIAIRHASELRPLSEWTRGELRQQAAAIAAGLRASGVGPGDRVAAYLPNIPETIAALVACASIGAVWSSARPSSAPAA